MQRPWLSGKDRVGALAAVAAVHAALFALLLLSGRGAPGSPEVAAPIEVFDVDEPPPPEPIVEQVTAERAPREEGASSPPNLESRATPVAAPEPRIALPRPSPVVASPTPNQGAQPTQGAAPVQGPGTGAGGSGTGTGSGGSGSGSGGGGMGSPPRLLSDRIRRSDFPKELRDSPVPAFVLRVEFTVGNDGRPSGCRVVQSSGNALLDRRTCDLYEQKVRYRPATDKAGKPIAVPVRTTRSWYIPGRARPVP